MRRVSSCHVVLSHPVLPFLGPTLISIGTLSRSSIRKIGIMSLAYVKSRLHLHSDQSSCIGASPAFSKRKSLPLAFFSFPSMSATRWCDSC